jgi:hypothetical protein
VQTAERGWVRCASPAAAAAAERPVVETTVVETTVVETTVARREEMGRQISAQIKAKMAIRMKRPHKGPHRSWILIARQERQQEGFASVVLILIDRR